MKRRNGLVRICVIGAALTGLGWLSSGALAQTANPASDAWAKADPVPYWWFHGTIEAGGRFFLNNPDRNGAVYLGQKSLAKFYEYRDLRPGAVSDFSIATGSKDGLYEVDLGGKNVGYDDQSYYFDASKAGEHYFNFQWDETPHKYSTSAMTPYFGVGTTALTLPSGLPSNVATNASIINPFLHQTDIGIRRDTASAEYRWTPTDAWDFNADYSHMRRTGTQIDGVVGFAPKGGSVFSSPTQVPKPVADTTQNYGVNGEYVGTSPWNQRISFKLAYNGSQYTDDFSSYTIQDPYCTGTTPATCGGTSGSSKLSPFARLSLWPSNQMNAFGGTLAADLPWQSRYVGTVNYTMMRQNAAFIPMTINPLATAAAQALPASSLNGAINTTLSNNVVTTKLTPNLTNKVSYRYYNFDNNTPELFFPSWVSYDHTNAAGAGTEAAIHSLTMSYVKQNAGEQLDWRPTNEWNLGAAYGYERYEWTRTDANATNENSGKVFVDWKPMPWVTVRSSGYYGNRRYDNYDYLGYVGNYQFVSASWQYQSSYRQLMFSNRETWKANASVDLVVLPGLSVTPTFQYRDMSYGVDPSMQQGLQDSRSWSAGVDATYLVNRDLTVMVGYMYENYKQLVYSDCNISRDCTGAPPLFSQTLTDDKTVLHTFTTMAKYTAIPDKLDLTLRYTLSRGVDQLRLYRSDGLDPEGGQFPDVTTWLQRLDAIAEYKFDKEQVAFFGWKGEVKAKLHYAWERNSVDNWANDTLAPYSPTVSPTAIWLGYDNPNYNVHMLMASLAFKW